MIALVLFGGADILVCPEGAPKTESGTEFTRRDKNVLHSRIQADKNVCPTCGTGDS